ncbi:MAG: glycosyltransferase family 2 protein [Planctomycetota bacterium]|nr:glycosyltransferase family 2 protein [Planctomycetota bacterium]
MITTAEDSWTIRVVIPALDEEASIGKVIDALWQHQISSIHVADNGSRDNTASVAREHGARVVLAPQRGYGSACLAALADITELEPSSDGEIIVFIDADFSDDPRQLPELVAPIIDQQADLVIGSRVLGHSEPGALSPHQRAGNRLATLCIRWLFGFRYTDLGPFRAIRRDRFDQLQMRDGDFGWTVEMQLKAARQRFTILEIPVDYRPRIGQSKISGTISGSIRAGAKILQVIFREALLGSRPVVTDESPCPVGKR